MKTNHMDSYGVFCMCDRLLTFGVLDIDELDARWEVSIVEYNKFLESEYNVEGNSLINCIDEYITNKKIEL